jgi:inward rectifier potassium channel
MPAMGGELGSTRVFGQGATGAAARVGMRRRPGRDLYHALVTGSWRQLLLLYGAVYFATQALFGLAHFYLSDADLGRGSLLAWALSFLPGAPVPSQDLPSPRALAAEVVLGAEGFIRWLELAVGSGIMFAKFSVVRARVLFSRVAVVAPHLGGEALMFRMANERTSHMVDAKVQAMLVWDEPGEGGDTVRRAHDLPLLRGGSALFAHAWTAIHPIDRDSPLLGQSAESLGARDAEVIVTLSGYDEDLTRTLHARHAYPASRIRWRTRFRDVVRTLPDGSRVIDYRRFHETDPVADGRDERTPRRAGPDRARAAAGAPR